jgi:ABC-type polysaccharide/polyol phosphate export permease
MIITGVQFSFYNFLIVIPLFLLLVIAMGAGLILSTIFVFFRDMGHLYSVVLMILMYMTPIFYPASIIPDKYHWIIELNPLYPVLKMFRDLMINGQLFEWYELLIAGVYAVIYFVVGVFVFYKKQDRFIFHI